jgi:exopolyphosphatase/guanosine-5'-triphosphate,3'-diphosphate pyrophosphatase
VARYHRKSDPPPNHVEFAALGEAAQREVSVLAGLLRIAIGLDRNHSARVRSLRVEESDKGLEVLADAVPGEDISLEVYAAGAGVGLLQRTLDVAVEVREV